jgi:hypothetical protein
VGQLEEPEKTGAEVQTFVLYYLTESTALAGAEKKK